MNTVLKKMPHVFLPLTRRFALILLFVLMNSPYVRGKNVMVRGIVVFSIIVVLVELKTVVRISITAMVINPQRVQVTWSGEIFIIAISNVLQEPVEIANVLIQTLTN